MAAVTTLRRVEVADRLRELLDTDGDNVVITGPPRNPQEGRLIVIGDITGELSVPHMKAGRNQYDDHFAIEVLCIAWDPGAEDFATVDTNAQELGEHVHDVIADSPQLQLVAANDGLDGVVSAIVGEFDGPNRWWNPEGAGSAMRITVDVHIRMS